MLEQTKNTRDALLAAGLSRKDFQVRTERLMNGSVFCGYGDARILIWNLEKAVKRTPEMLKNGLSVRHSIMSSGRILVDVVDDGKGIFKVTDYREENKNV